MASDTQAVDEEIKACTSHLCDLRSRKNSFLPIFRLPSETLSTIFIHCASDYHYASTGCRISTVPSWVDISYVCRHWRDVALNCPTLWTYHFVLSLRWTDELLERSKQASLKIHVDLSYREADHTDWLEKLMNHTERIQDLHLRLWDLRQNDLCWKLLTRLFLRARRLKSLVIVILAAQSPFNENTDQFYFPPGIDGFDTPALRHLHLSNCSIPWCSFMRSSLTTLNLRCVSLPLRKDVVEFLSMLGSMQELTHLYLLDALADTPSSPTTQVLGSSPQRINLPRLTRLLVTAPFPTVVTLLSCISIPSETELRLHFQSSRFASGRDSPCQVEYYKLILSLLADRFKSCEELASSRRMILAVTCGGDLEFTFSNANCALQWDGAKWELWDRGIPLRIRLWGHGGSHVRIIMDCMCSSLPLESVESVHIIGSAISSADYWRETTGHFPRLRHLKIIGGDSSVATIISVLSIPSYDGMENRHGDPDQCPAQVPIFAPALEELELCSVDFSPDHLSKGRQKKRWPGPACIQALLHAVSTRQTRCKLKMTQCCERKVNKNGRFSHKMVNVVGEWEGGEFKVKCL